MRPPRCPSNMERAQSAWMQVQHQMPLPGTSASRSPRQRRRRRPIRPDPLQRLEAELEATGKHFRRPRAPGRSGALRGGPATAGGGLGHLHRVPGHARRPATACGEIERAMEGIQHRLAGCRSQSSRTATDIWSNGRATGPSSPNGARGTAPTATGSSSNGAGAQRKRRGPQLQRHRPRPLMSTPQPAMLVDNGDTDALGTARRDAGIGSPAAGSRVQLGRTSAIARCPAGAATAHPDDHRGHVPPRDGGRQLLVRPADRGPAGVRLADPPDHGRRPQSLRRSSSCLPMPPWWVRSNCGPSSCLAAAGWFARTIARGRAFPQTWCGR